MCSDDRRRSQKQHATKAPSLRAGSNATLGDGGVSNATLGGLQIKGSITREIPLNGNEKGVNQDGAAIG